MTMRQMRFDDGAAYEIGMGSWSRPVGAKFLEWMTPTAGKDWLDVGCGNGAFTQLIAESCSPANLAAADPSPGQLDHARGRSISGAPQFVQADAMAMPFPDDSFDYVVSALVLFFVPEPARALSEMVRMVRPGGTVAAYLWDLPQGGFPYEQLELLFEAFGATRTQPPHAAIAEPRRMFELWHDAGLEDIATVPLTVERRFNTFDDYWQAAMATPGIVAAMQDMPEDQIQRIRIALESRLGNRPGEPVFVSARAHAVRGVRPV